MMNFDYSQSFWSKSKTKTLWLGMIMVLVCVLVLSSCTKPKSQERPPEPGDVAVARIQDHTIWSSDVRNEAIAQGLIGEGEPLDITSDLFRRMLEEVIDQKLLAREAEKKGLDRSIIAQRRLIAARERILGDMLVENTVDQAIDEKSVTALYQEQLRLSKQSEEVHARLILLRTREDADNIIKQLQAGALFEAMAMERSIDQATRFNGGDMGYFTTDIMPSNYKAALSMAKVGQIIGPVQTDGGWAIMRVEDRRAEQPPTMEEARPQILRFLTYDQVRILLLKLREGTRVTMLIKDSNLRSGGDQEPASAPKYTPQPEVEPSDSATSEDTGSSSTSSTSSSEDTKPKKAKTVKSKPASDEVAQAETGQDEAAQIETRASASRKEATLPKKRSYFAPADAAPKKKP